MTRGQCLCGAVRYEVDGPFDSMLNCHCSMCRKEHGAPFATVVTAPLAGFRWVSGEDSICTYKTQSGGSRSFCRLCGSVTPLFMSSMNLVAFPLLSHHSPEHLLVGLSSSESDAMVAESKSLAGEVVWFCGAPQ